MSYEVLARKYRPTRFDEIVGQQHVVRALVHALDHNRLHHAYLFTGTRGVGKTTLARLLARCLNCEAGVSSTPCGTCGICQQIGRGSFIDLMEVDAASHTGVDNIRELLDNTLYAPVQGRYKVYLIDEVHMLSKAAFNALLIRLEEPPDYVKFVLATTDPTKVPVTILSRCLQFHLHNLSKTQLASHLEQVLEQENVNFEAEGLGYLAKAADGSVRDALSLTDQAIAFGGGSIQSAQIVEMLGLVDQQLTGKLLQALALDDAKLLLQLAYEYLREGADADALLASLGETVHQIGLLQAVPDLDLDGAADSQQIHDLAKQLTAEAIQLYYQAALQGRKELPFAPDTTTGLYMTLLRMLAFKPLFGSTGGTRQKVPANQPPPVSQPASNVVPVGQDILDDKAMTRQKDAEREISQDPFVKKIQERFGATVTMGSIRPRYNSTLPLATKS